jgi:hypothetical protein
VVQSRKTRKNKQSGAHRARICFSPRRKAHTHAPESKPARQTSSMDVTAAQVCTTCLVMMEVRSEKEVAVHHNGQTVKKEVAVIYRG